MFRPKNLGKAVEGLFSRLIPSIYRQDPSVKRSIYKWLLIGLLIRLTFIPFTVYFPDLLAIYWRASLIAFRGIYGVVGAQIFVHYIHSFFLLIFKPLMPYFDNILNDPQMGILATWEMFSTFVNHPNVFRTLFLFKMPYLLFELGCVFLLLNIFQDRKKGLRAFMFWILNPVVIFVTYVAPRYEIIAIFFILLSVYYARNNKFLRCGLSLGLAIITRYYPLILVPFFVIILGKNLWQRLKLAFWMLFPLGITVILARSFSGTGELGNLMKTHFTDYFLVMKFNLSYGYDKIYVFVLMYTICFLYFYFYTDHSFASLRRSTLVVMLVYFATCFFHVQYFMWLIPFLVLQVAEDKRFVGLFAIQVIGFVVYTFQWPHMFSGYLFTPINPWYFMNLRGPGEVINQYYPIDKFVGIFRSILSGVSLWMVYLIFKESFLARKREKG